MADNAANAQGKHDEHITLTQADIERIKALPERTFIIGNLETRGLYDEETKRFYLLDENGKWNRKVAIIKSPVPSSNGSGSAEDSENEPEGENDGASEEEAPKKQKGRLRDLLEKAKNSPDVAQAKDSVLSSLSKPIGKKLPLTRLHVLIAGIVLGVLMLVVIVPAINQVFTPNIPGGQSATSPATPPQSSQQQVEIVDPDPTLTNINVIQAKQALIPGDTITTDNIQAAEISAADYELLRASGRTLYQWEVANNLVGMVVTKYIPKGGYLASGDENTTYTPSPNPWVNEQADMTYVTVPLNGKATDPLLNFGAQVDLDVVKTITTSQEPDATTGEMVTLIKTKEYSYHPAIICDILNANGESIYPLYYAYMSIPAAERLDYLKSALLAEGDLKSKLTPVSVRIKISTADAEAIQNFTGSDVKITWGNFSADAVDMTTDAKRSFATEAKSIKSIIEQAIKENEQAIKDAEASIQSQAQAQIEQQQEEVSP